MFEFFSFLPVKNDDAGFIVVLQFRKRLVKKGTNFVLFFCFLFAETEKLKERLLNAENEENNEVVYAKAQSK